MWKCNLHGSIQSNPVLIQYIVTCLCVTRIGSLGSSYDLPESCVFFLMNCHPELLDASPSLARPSFTSRGKLDCPNQLSYDNLTTVTMLRPFFLLSDDDAWPKKHHTVRAPMIDVFGT